MRVFKRLAPSVLALAASGLLVGPSLAQAPLAYRVTIAPQADPKANVTDLALTLQLDAAAEAGKPLLRMPLVNSNVDTMATAIEGLSAFDTLGAFELTARDTGGANASREWSPSRATKGPVTVRYRVPANAVLPPRGPAPPLSLSNEAAAFSGVGAMFLMTPIDQAAKYRVEITWDLKKFSPDARAYSSLGDGRATKSGTLSPRDLGSVYFMGGQIKTEPARFPDTGLVGGWQGDPGFDGAALMKWAADLYVHQSRFFGQKSAPFYSVFLRHNPINAGGGVALYKSFVITYGGKGKGASASALKETLSHEMFHTFQPKIGEEGSWFSEGSAVFYQARLPTRVGLMPVDQFLSNLNFHVARYYTSAMSEVPNAQINAGFWKDTRIRTLPYDRGMLYLVTVDEALRKASGGKRSLDDLILEMRDRQAAKPNLSNEDWRDVVVKALGEDSGKAFDAFLAGARPVPTSEAFGACFRRVEVPMRAYEVGFEPAVLGEPKRIVRGLVAGSNAEGAGLRNGDEIVKPVPQDAIQGNQTEQLQLVIRRDGKEFPLSYLPRGASVMAYQWERVKNVPDERCKL